MTNIIFLLISLLVSAIIALPILQARQGRGRGQIDPNFHRSNDLEDRKNTIYASIKEIDFDYQMWKLSKEDYEELRTNYKQDAINVLQEIDALSNKRAKKRASKGQKVTSKTKVKFCWHCGSSLSQSSKFCVDCGTEIDNASI